MKLPCPACQRPLNLPDELAGKVARCPACQESLRVPALPEEKPGLLARISGPRAAAAGPASLPAGTEAGATAAALSDELALQNVPELAPSGPPMLEVCPYCGRKWRLGATVCGKCHYNAVLGRRVFQHAYSRFLQFDIQKIFLYIFIVAALFGGYWLYNNWHSVSRDVSDFLDGTERREPSADDTRSMVPKGDGRKLGRD